VQAIRTTQVSDLAPGVPPLTIPAVDLPDLALLLAGALGTAVVSLADTITTARRSRPARAARSTADGR
jgi:hypothetical protein